MLSSSKYLLLSALVLILLLPGSLLAGNVEWAEGATLVGLCGFADYDDAAMQVDQAVAAGASVIDIHAGLTGDYETFMAPDSALALISFIANEVHKHDRKVVCYIAGLEVISHNLDSGHSALKDHPNWAQRNIDGEPALFDSKAAFWIPEGTEDIWLSPFAQDWLDLYLPVVARLAKSGVDGVYLDIPYWMTHFDGWGDTWASFDEATVAAFYQRTGLNAFDAKLGDFSDPVFQQWVRFRMNAIDEFVTRVHDTIKGANPDCAFVVELYPGPGMAPVVVGSDPYRLTKLCDVIGHEYNPFEVSSDRGAHHWRYFQAGAIAMRAFEEGKPSWMLTYAARQDWTGDQVQASANLAFSHIALGYGFWENGGVRMCNSTVSPVWRSKALNWIQDHKGWFYPNGDFFAGGYAIYFSPESRTWGGQDVVDSFYGTSMLLLEAMVPYTVITPRTLADAHPKILILPDAVVLSDMERAHLSEMADAGTIIVVTGDTGTMAPDITQTDRFALDSPNFHRIQGDPGSAYLHGLALTESWEEPRDSLPDEQLNALAKEFWDTIPALSLEDTGIRLSGGEDVQVYTYPREDGFSIQLFNTAGLVAGDVVHPTPQNKLVLEIAGKDWESASLLHAFGDEVPLKLKKKKQSTTISLPRIEVGASIRLVRTSKEME